MSYSLYIVDPETGEEIETDTPHMIAGGTYQVGGTTRLWLDITYNYAPFFYRAETLGESTKIYGETPVDGCLPVLREEYGGIYGLQYISIPEARKRVLGAINVLRDANLDEHGNPYDGKELDMPPTSYWAPTERNARRALINLLNLLMIAPDNAKIQIG